jgi:acyl dehydratase
MKMITDQFLVSARAEKQSGLGRRIVRGLLTASAALALTLPSLAAWGLDSPQKTPTSGKVFEKIALPPIPYLDSMPWLQWNAGDTLKVDTLLAPLPDPWGLKLAPAGHDNVKPAVS